MVRDLNLIVASGRRLAGIASLCVFAVWPSGLLAQARPVPDTFDAATAEMTPAGTSIKVDVIDWSDEAERAAALAALGSEGGVTDALRELPTAGYVWIGGSGVGYAIKYAHRATGGDGSETITIVTERPLGAYAYKPWTAPDAREPLDYGVLELRLGVDGRGRGTLSLVAAVTLDAGSQTISLERGAPTVLVEALRRPKPYWARDDEASH